MDIRGLLQSKWSPSLMLTLQEAWYVHVFMNKPKSEFISYIYSLLQV